MLFLTGILWNLAQRGHGVCTVSEAPDFANRILSKLMFWCTQLKGSLRVTIRFRYCMYSLQAVYQKLKAMVLILPSAPHTGATEARAWLIAGGPERHWLADVQVNKVGSGLHRYAVLVRALNCRKELPFGALHRAMAWP